MSKRMRVEKAVTRILAVVKSRQTGDRWGIGTAGVYVRQLLSCGYKFPGDVDSLLKRADSTLVYCHPDMLVEKEAGGKFDPTPNAILEFNCIITTKSMDRDGDVLHPDGADLDPMCPLLWQHDPNQPIGKLVRQLSKNEQQLRGRFAIANTTLGKDAATLVEFGALRISHGFLPKKFKERHSKDSEGVEWRGWEITSYSVMETSVVSVPSNAESVITAYSRNKLFDPMVKSWAGKLFESRKTVVQGVTIPTVETIEPQPASCGNTLIDALFKGKAKPKTDPEEEEVEEEDPDNEPEDHGISERMVTKCAAGIKGCEHFGQAFVNHGSKTVHHTICANDKCWSGFGKKATDTERKEGEDGEPKEPQYQDPDAIRAEYMKCKGVKHVVVAPEYHPPLGKGWKQLHPIARDWTEAVNDDQQQQQGGGNNQQQNTNGQDNNQRFGKKWWGGPVSGSWDDIRQKLQGLLVPYLVEQHIIAPGDNQTYACISGMFDDHAIVEICRMQATIDAHADAYAIDWTGGNEPSWSGEPRKVEIVTTVDVHEAKALELMTKAKDGGKKDPHLNEDGTFKGGFDGCVECQQSCHGKSEESAKKICAAIGRAAGKIASFHHAVVASVDDFIGLSKQWADNGVEVIGGRLIKTQNEPPEVQSITFDAKQWTEEEAKSWLTVNGYETVSFCKAKSDAEHTVHISCKGEAGPTIHKMMQHIQRTANAGHSFSVVVDPDGKEAKSFGIDGDGADHITDVVLEQHKKSTNAAVAAGGGEVVVKSGRVLNQSNEGHIKEAMTCHQEILGMGKEHASRACKALVKEAHNHLDEVMFSVGPVPTEKDSNEPVSGGKVKAYLATEATPEELEESRIIILGRQKQQERERSRKLLDRFLERR